MFINPFLSFFLIYYTKIKNTSRVNIRINKMSINKQINNIYKEITLNHNKLVTNLHPSYFSNIKLFLDIVELRERRRTRSQAICVHNRKNLFYNYYFVVINTIGTIINTKECHVNI